MFLVVLLVVEPGVVGLHRLQEFKKDIEPVQERTAAPILIQKLGAPLEQLLPVGLAQEGHHLEELAQALR